MTPAEECTRLLSNWKRRGSEIEPRGQKVILVGRFSECALATTDESSPVRLPLFSATVDYAVSAKGTCAMAIATHETRNKGRSWLVFSESVHAPQALLKTCGIAVVRQDFESAWFTETTPLNQGATAIVFKAQPRPETQGWAVPGAVKIFKDKKRATAARELALLRGLSPHPHIVNCLAAFLITPDRASEALLFELYPLGDLWDRVESHGRLSEACSREVFRCLASALLYLHGIDIVHRDVKSENSLLKTPEHAVLADFGSAIRLKDLKKWKDCPCSAGFAAPEIFQQKQHTPSADIFGLGCTLFHALAGHLPFGYGTFTEVKQRNEALVICSMSETLSTEAENLLSNLLRSSPDERVTASDALNHLWLLPN